MFKISEQYGRGTERFLSQSFRDANTAKSFIQEKLQEQSLMGVAVIYRLYDFDELVQEFDSTKIENTTSSSQEATSSGKGTGANFSPSPLSTKPRPGGMPHSSWRDDEDKKGK